MQKINSRYRLIVSYIVLLILIFLVLLVLRHSWYFTILNKQVVKDAYPHFHEFVIFIGNNSIYLFYLVVVIFIVSSLLFVFKYLNNNKTFLFLIAATLIFLIIGEVILHIFGFHPGYHTNSQYFTPVDSLIEYKGFCTDENGITKIDSVAGMNVAKRINENNNSLNDNEVGEVNYLSYGMIQFQNREFNNSLFNYYEKLKNKPKILLSKLEKEILHYIQNPINDDGFRSISFQPYSHHKPSMLLLGDSFTWGHSATNLTNSFADILLSKGYIVYNTGITATDPSQYLAIAKKYIPVLKPDYVIVNFFIGNDIQYFSREVKSHQPVFYATNAGILMANTEGVFFPSSKAAYQNVIDSWSIPENKSIFNKLMAQTSITSLIWKIMNPHNLFPDLINLFPYLYIQTKVIYDQARHERRSKTPYCNIELKEIEKICELNESIFILSSIPEVYRWTEKKTQDFLGLFEGLNYVEMKTEKSDYVLSNAHFNDKGHAKYAVFLDSIIKAQKPIIEN